jgi:hypothetical protein
MPSPSRETTLVSYQSRLDGGAVDWGWLPDGPAQRVPANQGARLDALRRTVYEEAMANREKGAVSVVLYALTTVGKNPDEALSRAKAYADQMGWRTANVLFDDCGMTAPATRDGWRKAIDHVAGGYAHGILTVNRSAVGASDSEYEQVLQWLRLRVVFLAHVPQQWRPSEPGHVTRSVRTSLPLGSN